MKSLLTVGVCVLIFASVLSGCRRGGSGEKLTEVSGKVTLDDQPVAGLQVVFEPKDQTKPSSVGYTQADGTYRLTLPGGEPGAVQGTHVVRVTGEESDAGPAPTIAPRFNENSELTCEVGAESVTHNIQLTSS